MEKIITVNIPQAHIEECKKLLEQYAKGSGFPLTMYEYFPENPKPGMVTLNLNIPGEKRLLNMFSLDLFIESQLPNLVRRANANQ